MRAPYILHDNTSSATNLCFTMLFVLAYLRLYKQNLLTSSRGNLQTLSQLRPLRWKSRKQRVGFQNLQSWRVAVMPETEIVVTLVCHRLQHQCPSSGKKKRQSLAQQRHHKPRETRKPIRRRDRKMNRICSGWGIRCVLLASAILGGE